MRTYFNNGIRLLFACLIMSNDRKREDSLWEGQLVYAHSHTQYQSCSCSDFYRLPVGDCDALLRHRHHNSDDNRCEVQRWPTVCRTKVHADRTLTTAGVTSMVESFQTYSIVNINNIRVLERSLCFKNFVLHMYEILPNLYFVYSSRRLTKDNSVQKYGKKSIM